MTLPLEVQTETFWSKLVLKFLKCIIITIGVVRISYIWRLASQI